MTEIEVWAWIIALGQAAGEEFDFDDWRWVEKEVPIQGEGA